MFQVKDCEKVGKWKYSNWLVGYSSEKNTDFFLKYCRWTIFVVWGSRLFKSESFSNQILRMYDVLAVILTKALVACSHFKLYRFHSLSLYLKCVFIFGIACVLDCHMCSIAAVKWPQGALWQEDTGLTTSWKYDNYFLFHPFKW